MGRVQLALNVADLNEAITFYTKLFDIEPAKVRAGYANFAVEDPPLKLVLFEGGQPGMLNHLGIEVDSTDEVMAASARISAEGLATEEQRATACCFAVQDKVWVTGPDNAWEIYTVLADAPAEAEADACGAATGCCS